MVDLHLFLPVLPEHGGLLHVLSLTVPLIFLRTSFTLRVLLWDPSFMVKCYWRWVGGCGLQHFSVSPRPLGFGIGTKGFGARA